MPGFGFGKRPKPRRFDYIPRFYDEAKEALEERIKSYSGDLSDEEKAKHRISSGLRHKYYGDPKYRSRQVNKSNLRLVYIIIVLFFVTYIILKSDRFLNIIDSLG